MSLNNTVLVSYAMSEQTLPCTPPPKKIVEGGFIFFVSVSSVPKNVFEGKPVLFGVFQIKRPQNVVFEHIRLN